MNKRQAEENTKSESNTYKCVGYVVAGVTIIAVTYMTISHGYSVSITKGDFVLSLTPSALPVAA